MDLQSPLIRYLSLLLLKNKKGVFLERRGGGVVVGWMGLCLLTISISLSRHLHSTVMTTASTNIEKSTRNLARFIKTLILLGLFKYEI